MLWFCFSALLVGLIMRGVDRNRCFAVCVQVEALRLRLEAGGSEGSRAEVEGLREEVARLERECGSSKEEADSLKEEVEGLREELARLERAHVAHLEGVEAKVKEMRDQHRLALNAAR
jgi:hypothetical protein